MLLFQTADVLKLTGLTRSQLREWCSVRNLVPADVPANGPGRHALFSWQTALTLRLLKAIQGNWGGEVAGWAEAACKFRETIEDTPFPALWGTTVRFDEERCPAIFRQGSIVADRPMLSLPLDPHLLVLASTLAIPPPNQLHLFPPMAVSQ